MDEAQKRRVSIFITGVIIGSFASMFLFFAWQRSEGGEPETGETTDVIVAACDIAEGDAITRECTSIRTEVPVRFVPPGTLLGRDLEMVVGRKVVAPIAKGNAVRDADLKKVE